MTKKTFIDNLLNQGVSSELLNKINSSFPPGPEGRQPDFIYLGRQIWEDAIRALLVEENILLVGPKATGKNVLAENLAYLFSRPCKTVSFHINTDASSLIGSDTFKDGEVQFRPGPIYQAAGDGSFAILDEINMARNDAVAVLHAALDYRRVIDLPGYESIRLNPSTRFIATMNDGYLGTRELNEALLSRFMIIRIPAIGKSELDKLLSIRYPNLNKKVRLALVKLFDGIHEKNAQGEISSKALDLRGLLAALAMIEIGHEPQRALDMGLSNKSMDPFEQDLVRDLIHMYLANFKAGDFFKEGL